MRYPYDEEIEFIPKEYLEERDETYNRRTLYLVVVLILGIGFFVWAVNNIDSLRQAPVSLFI